MRFIYLTWLHKGEYIECMYMFYTHMHVHAICDNGEFRYEHACMGIPTLLSHDEQISQWKLLLQDPAGKGPAVPGATDDDHDAEEESNLIALQKYNMIDARLRRLCERKPSEKINVPMAIHEQWKLGGRSRDELRVLLEKYDFDKAI